MSKLLYTGTAWDLNLIDDLWEVIDKIATEKYGLTYYEPQIEIVTADQMLYHHSMHALPLLYKHWSFGKNYIEAKRAYQKGQTSIAYETIINTDPMITYIMEDNSATMQATVLAHAVCGHGSFFKNNYLFKRWTDAGSIVDYLVFAKRYVEKCEERYGEENVERFLDAAHALWLYGVDKYKRRRKAKASDQDKKRMEWAAYEKETADAFWDDMFKPDSVYEGESDKHIWPYPEENLLYFVQKNAPHMPEWKRELLRIVRKTAQYFYPQIQTKLMNEGWASFWHYTLMGDLYEGGHINEGSYLEFLDSHTAITNQYGIKDGVQAAMNPYALGFRMFQDIKRACENPTEEDYRTMPLCAGQPWLATMTEIMENFKDENFVLEFLSPKVIKDLKMCCIEDDADKDYVKFLHIQDGDDYRKIRKYLAKQYSYDNMLPSVEVVGFAERGDRTLYLRHTEVEGRTLERETEKATTKYLHKLWGYPIELQKTDGAGTELIRTRRNY